MRFDFHARDDTLRFERLGRLDGALLVVFLPIDLKQSNLGLAVDPLGIDKLFLGDTDALGLLLGPDLCVADADCRVRALLLDGGELRGPPRLDVAGLIDARVFEVAIDLDGALLGLIVLELDLQTGLIFDAISKLAALLRFPR